MAYLGKSLVGILNESKTIDTMTGNGSTTTLTLSKTPGSVNNVEVYMDGVFQTPSVEYTLSGNTVSFSTAPENGMVVVALSGNDSEIITPNDNSISGSKIAGAVVTDAKIAGMAANKLNGALPAVDGSALTNMPSAVTKSASDPATDSNPAGGVGTIWANTTSGEMYVLIDATTDANIWFNVGGGDGDVVPWTFQGTVSGYSSGGHSDPNGFFNVIEKFPFASDTNATDVGDMTATRFNPSGQTSSTHGYIAGGGPAVNIIDKFTFAADNDATDVGDLTVARRGVVGQSSPTHGYASGGDDGPDNVIDKFSFSVDGNATDVGDLTITRGSASSQTSSTHGYTAGGAAGSTYLNTIDKFTFSADANATDVGDLINNSYGPAGQSSTTHGFVSGGFAPSYLNSIVKFTFASNANATDHADITVARHISSGQSSTTHGYMCGGSTGPVNNTIDKFPFASQTNATDVGDLTAVKFGLAGHQV